MFNPAPPKKAKPSEKQGIQKSKEVEAQLQIIMRVQMPIVRGAFKQVDSARQGSADKEELRKALLDRLFIAPLSKTSSERERDQWSRALDLVLSSADPNGTGVVEFGRLTRLIRSMKSTNEGESVGVSDAELRERFGGVDVGNKFLTRRLKDGRALESMPTATRTSSILGDSNVPTPWAQIGDDSRMDHVLQNVRKEKLNVLQNALLEGERQCAAEKSSTDKGRASLVQRNTKGKGQGSGHLDSGNGMTLKHFKTAMKKFDCHMRDAEIEQYHTCLQRDAVSKPPSASARSRCHSARAPPRPWAPRRGHGPDVSSKAFMTQYSQSVVGTTSLRNSADFTMKWEMPKQR